MKPTFRTTMRAATDATRAGNLTEATRLIQSALSGSGPGSATQSGVSAQPEASTQAINASRIDKGAEVLEPETDAHHPPLRARGKLYPLGETIRSLRKGPKPGPTAFGRAFGKTSLQMTVPDGGQFVSRSAPSTAGSNDFRLYIPSTAPRGLIVMLHGCSQSADDFAIGTGMHAVAEENAFIVAYPQQPQSANPQGCWNWFDPRHQSRGSGEPESLARITRALLGEFDLTDAFVAGLSAGGAMAAVMGESYPDLYKGVGIHSGLAPGSASDVMGALAAMRGDWKVLSASGNRVPTIVFHGGADAVVHASNVDAILQAGAAGEPDAAVETLEIGGRTVLRTDYDQGRIELWRIEGGGHAWSGGQPQGSYTDPTGPDASREMMRFFRGRDGRTRPER